MSRYFFHIRDGLILVPDEEGMECRDMRAVEDEARASARDLGEEALRNRFIHFLPSIEVEDELGRDVYHAAPGILVH
jgi:hypothetical protein